MCSAFTHIPLNNWKYDHVFIKLQKDILNRKQKMNPNHFQDIDARRMA